MAVTRFNVHVQLPGNILLAVQPICNQVSSCYTALQDCQHRDARLYQGSKMAIQSIVQAG